MGFKYIIINSAARSDPEQRNDRNDIPVFPENPAGWLSVINYKMKIDHSDDGLNFS